MKHTIISSNVHSSSKKYLTSRLPHTALILPPPSPPIITASMEFKNAVYYGQIQAGARQGIGITMYDDGDILIGIYQHGQLFGHFVYYCNAHAHAHAQGVCYYGSIYGNNLDGECNVYHRATGQLHVREFGMGINTDQSPKWSHLYGNQKKQRLSDGEDILLGKKNINETNPNIINIVKLHAKKLAPNHSQAINPTSFISEHLCEASLAHSATFASDSQSDSQLRLCQISHTQLYYGTLKDGRPHGHGIIFMGEWPVCYGCFAHGDLSGLARVEQNRLMILDGVFEGSTMKQGWVLDYIQNLTSYGHVITGQKSAGNMTGIGHENHSQNTQRFQLIQQHTGICPQNILKYRRINHIRSLSYVNEYCVSLLPKLQVYFQLTTNQSQTQAISEQHGRLAKENGEGGRVEQNFHPPFITSISRVNGSPDGCKNKHEVSSNMVEKDLLDLIQEHTLSKSIHTRNSIMLQQKLIQESHIQDHYATCKTHKYKPSSKSKSRSLRKSMGKGLGKSQNKNKSKSKNKNNSNSKQEKFNALNSNEVEKSPSNSRGKGRHIDIKQEQRTDRINGYISNIAKLSSQPYSKKKTTPLKPSTEMARQQAKSRHGLDLREIYSKHLKKI